MKAGLNDGSSFAIEADYDPDKQTPVNVAALKSAWISPQLKEFGNLSFVIKGISYSPGDAATNLTP